MKIHRSIKLYVSIIILLTLSACGGGSAPAGDSGSDTLTVSGTVVDSNGTEIQDATVTISSDSVVSQIDANGAFTAQISAGEHHLAAKQDGTVFLEMDFTTTVGSDLDLGTLSPTSTYLQNDAQSNEDYFPNGVATGDVNQTSTILWAQSASERPITFEYCEKPNESEKLEVSDFTGCANNAIVKDVIDPDRPEKVKISGLKSGTLYQYRVCEGEFCPKSGLHSLIDIKPDSDPNSVNPRSKGVIPVAVLREIGVREQ